MLAASEENAYNSTNYLLVGTLSIGIPILIKWYIPLLLENGVQKSKILILPLKYSFGSLGHSRVFCIEVSGSS